DLFDITSTGPATQLAMTYQPSGNLTAGVPFGLTVEARNADGNRDASFNGPVTLTLANNPSGTTLGGTLTVNAVNGWADFENLTPGQPGSGYTPQATSPGLSVALSNSINIPPPGVATGLVVTAPPLDVTAGTAFGLVVEAQDDFGTIDTSFNAAVTVAQ